LLIVAANSLLCKLFVGGLRMAGDLVQIQEARAAQRVEEARLAVNVCLRDWRAIGGRDPSQGGAHFRTPAADQTMQTITMSVREALALVRVTGPVSAQQGSGSSARLMTALHVLHAALLRAPLENGRGMGVVAAMQVVQVAISDHMYACSDLTTRALAASHGVPRRRRARKFAE
jgi:hypothetical protein